MNNRSPERPDSSPFGAYLVERLGILTQAGKEIIAPDSSEDALLRMAAQALPWLGSWCVVDVVEEDGGIRRIGVRHEEIEPDHLPGPLVEEWVPGDADPFGGGRVCRTGKSEIISFVSDPIIDRGAGSPRVARALRELGMGSLLTVPLRGPEGVSGAMTFVSVTPDAFSQQDLLLAEELGRLGALSLENARLRRSAGEFSRAVEDMLAENIRLNRRLVEVNEQLLLSAVREHEEATTAKDRQKETEALFSIIFERAAMGIAVLDLDGRVADSNPALQAMLGYSREGLRGKHLTDLSEGREGKREWALFRELISGDRDSFQIERRARRLDGSVFWTNSVTSLGSSEHGPVFAITLTEDITERKRMEEQLRQSQRMEAIGRLAGGIAHDFNNILMVLGGRAEITLADLDPDDPLRADLDEIREGVERAAGVTRRLLAFSRKQMLQPRVLRLEELLDGMKRMLVPLIGPVQLTTSVGPDVGSVRADPSQIEQIIMNLVVNARDSMADSRRRQELAISLRSEEVGQGRISSVDGLIRPGQYVVLSVSDTGTGIPSEMLPIIMEPFFTTKEVGKGTGLGLSMVYGIVKQSGGFVDVSSEVGRGTTFEIFLPRLDPAASAAPKPAPPEAPTPPARKTPEEEEEDRAPSILVVDDEDAIRALLTRVLERTGFRVITARSSIEAMETLKGHDVNPFDLVVMDVMMPDMRGTDLARELRTRIPGLCTLFISGHDEEAVLEPEDLGEGTDFLTKPFTPAALLEKVRALLPFRHP